MKQRITTDQLQELTKEQKQKLRDWWKPEQGDAMYDKVQGETFLGEALGYDESAILLTGVLPLLSVGQMIELLQTTNKIVELDHKGIIQDEDICNQLWSAVKEVL